MSDQIIDLQPDLVALGWGAAQASNLAFDAQQLVERGLANDRMCVAFEQARVRAQVDFEVLASMAGLVMRMPGSPFSVDAISNNNAVQTTRVEVPDSFENLRADYLESVVNIYGEVRESTDHHISAERLPEAYRLPELSMFADQILALAPTYEAFAAKGWQPELVFVPQGLNLGQWNGILSGQALPSKSTSKGVWLSWAEYPGEAIGPIADIVAKENWDVAVVSAANKPIFVNIDADGQKGPGVEIATQELSGLPGVDATQDVVRLFTPSYEVYLALQSARLERGRLPVDTITWTLARESVTYNGEVRALTLDWNPWGAVRLAWSERSEPGHTFRRGGIRPSMRGMDVVGATL